MPSEHRRCQGYIAVVLKGTTSCTHMYMVYLYVYIGSYIIPYAAEEGGEVVHIDFTPPWRRISMIEGKWLGENHAVSY